LDITSLSKLRTRGSFKLDGSYRELQRGELLGKVGTEFAEGSDLHKSECINEVGGLLQEHQTKLAPQNYKYTDKLDCATGAQKVRSAQTKNIYSNIYIPAPPNTIDSGWG
jgi:hypothetical protein